MYDFTETILKQVVSSVVVSSAKTVMHSMEFTFEKPPHRILFLSQLPCLDVFISSKMKANTFPLLFTDLCKASLIIAFRHRERMSLWCPPTAVRQQGG